MAERGFTLVELMIVVAIIGVISVIAIPLYNNFMINSANKACLYEAKAYANLVFVELFDGDTATPPPAPIMQSCISITNAVGWTSVNIQPIIAVPRSPGNKQVICNITGGAVCQLSP